MPMRAYVFALSALLLTLSIVPAQSAGDKDIKWYRGTPQGNRLYQITQCQSITFDWESDKFQDGDVHSVVEFNSEDDYNNCDFTNVTPLSVGRSAASTVTVGGSETLDVTKRWFASDQGDDCANGNMKTALKIRPLLQYKFDGRKCTGGRVNLVRKEPTVKACRKRCKRRRGCLAVQYTNTTTECVIYSQVPTGISFEEPDSSCEIATTSCDRDDTLSLSEPEPLEPITFPPVQPTPRPPTFRPPTQSPPTPRPPTLRPPTLRPPAPSPPVPTAPVFSCANSRGFSSRQQVGLVANPPLDEASGIVHGYANSQTLYTHNDFNGRPEIYAIATSEQRVGNRNWRAGELMSVFKIGGADFYDYEDIAIGPGPSGPSGPGYVYVGDIGDNGNDRDSIFVYRNQEPNLAAGSYTMTDTNILELQYSNGKGVNAECLMFDSFDNRLYIVTKRNGEIWRTAFVWPNGRDAQMNLEYVGKLGDLRGRVTGCDISRSGREILIKYYEEVVYYCRSLGESLAAVLSNRNRGRGQPYREEPLGEAITFANDRDFGYYTLSESSGASTIPLYYYSRN